MGFYDSDWAWGKFNLIVLHRNSDGRGTSSSTSTICRIGIFNVYSSCLRPHAMRKPAPSWSKRALWYPSLWSDVFSIDSYILSSVFVTSFAALLVDSSIRHAFWRVLTVNLPKHSERIPHYRQSMKVLHPKSVIDIEVSGFGQQCWPLKASVKPLFPIRVFRQKNIGLEDVFANLTELAKRIRDFAVPLSIQGSTLAVAGLCSW